MAGGDVGKVVVDGPVIGIDIGNTSSCVAVWHNNKVEVIPNDVNERVTPSCVKFVDNRVLVGRAERSLLNSIPENTISDVKRLIGRRYRSKEVQEDMKHWPFRVVEGRGGEAMICVYNIEGKGEEKTVAEISALLVRNMKDSAEAFLGKEVSNAVITVPACFNDSQRRATKDACQIAGLNVLRIINDTTAAALAYAQHEKGLKKKKNVLVFDLGGGTLDVSIVEIEGCHFEVKAVAGDTHLGGKDVDDRMVEHMVSQLKTQSNIDIATGNPKDLAKLRREWEKAKRSLSNAKNVRIDTGFLREEEEEEEEEMKLVVSRTEFEDLNREFFYKCLEQVKLCLNDATMRTEDIDQVVLVGGSSRISKVRQLLKDYFEGKEPYYGLDPETAVACGAAILGSNIIVTQNQDHELIIINIRDLIIEEILPFSLGVGGKEGIMDVIARKGTTIPFNSNKIHTTHSDNLTDITYDIHIGEETVAIDNQFLGHFQIAGIKPAPAGVPRLLVTYSVDLNGMLNIVADELTGEAVHNITIIETSQGMVKDETEKQSLRGPVLGIDFGTSNICMAVWEHGQVQVIEDDQGCRVMPSYVSFVEEEEEEEDDEILFGEAAKSNMVCEPLNTIFGIKRLIGRQYDDKIIEEDMKWWPFEVVEGDGGKATIAVRDHREKKLYTPEQLLSHILAH